MVSVGNCSSVILTLEANNVYLSVAKHGYIECKPNKTSPFKVPLSIFIILLKPRYSRVFAPILNSCVAEKTSVHSAHVVVVVNRSFRAWEASHNHSLSHHIFSRKECY